MSPPPLSGSQTSPLATIFPRYPWRTLCHPKDKQNRCLLWDWTSQSLRHILVQEQRNVINTCIYSRLSTLPFAIKVRLDTILEKLYAIATFVLDIPKVVHCGFSPQTWFALCLYYLYLLPRPRLLIVKGSSTNLLGSLHGYPVEQSLLHPASFPNG